MLTKLERVIGSTWSSTLGGSPFWARTGQEPRTSLSTVNVDFTSSDYGELLLGLPGVDDHDLQEVIAQHHAQLDRVHGRVSLAVSLAQSLTKARWDASRIAGDFKLGEWVLIYFGAPNRIMPFFRGPYVVTEVSADNNFVRARHYLTPGEGAPSGPFYHVSRLLQFDFSRATPSDLAEFQLSEGTDLVKNILDHRQLANGSYEFLVEWTADPVPSWLGGLGLRRVIKAIDYCKLHGLPSLGSGPRRMASSSSSASAGPTGRGAAQRRGRGRPRHMS